MAFQPDRRFESLEDAFAFLLGEQARQPIERLWVQTSAGLVVPHEVPRFLFRGECGEFETTTSSVHRSETYTLGDGRHLSVSDRKTLCQLVRALAWCLVDKEEYSLDEPHAYGLLQHYGMPTPIIDFTGSVGYAFAFAAARNAAVGRIAILTLPEARLAVDVVDFTGHPWAERAQRQAAFGITSTEGVIDLKSDAARSCRGLRWYEFPVLPADHEYLNGKYQELLQWTDDPSAGFLRFHITEFVEGHGKFSPELTDWLLERVPMAPYCYLPKRLEGNHVVVNFRSAKDLQSFDENIEREYSRRYWSCAHPECSSPSSAVVIG